MRAFAAESLGVAMDGPIQIALRHGTAKSGFDGVDLVAAQSRSECLDALTQRGGFDCVAILPT
jgi:hypothetical protein